MIHANKIAFINSQFASSGLISEFESPSNFFEKCSSYHVLGKWTFFRIAYTFWCHSCPLSCCPCAINFAIVNALLILVKISLYHDVIREQIYNKLHKLCSGKFANLKRFVGTLLIFEGVD